ncbi:MAG: ribonuclease E/G, partial [Actinomycetota bacterium]
MPERAREGKPSAAAAEQALVKKAPRKPKIGDTMPVPSAPPPGPATSAGASGDSDSPGGGAGRGGKKKRRRGGRGGQGRSGGGGGSSEQQRGAGGRSGASKGGSGDDDGSKSSKSRRGRRGGRSRTKGAGADQDLLEQRKGRERNGKPIGRYFMCVQVRPGMAQVAVMEGRNLIEHYVSRPADDVSQIHGNIYIGKVQNVLPGMEAAFVDIATPKNAVLYRSDVQYE